MRDCGASAGSFIGTTAQRSNHQSTPTMLMQIPSPTPDQFRDWILSAVAALSVAGLIRQFIRKPPLEAEFLNRREFADFKAKLDKDFDATWSRIDRSFDLLNRRLDEMNQNDERRTATLDARINEVRSLVDRVDERTKPLTEAKPLKR